MLANYSAFLLVLIDSLLSATLLPARLNDECIRHSPLFSHFLHPTAKLIFKKIAYLRALHTHLHMPKFFTIL